MFSKTWLFLVNISTRFFLFSLYQARKFGRIKQFRMSLLLAYCLHDLLIVIEVSVSCQAYTNDFFKLSYICFPLFAYYFYYYYRSGFNEMENRQRNHERKARQKVWSYFILLYILFLCRGVSKYLHRYLFTKLPTSRTELFKQMLNGHI